MKEPRYSVIEIDRMRAALRFILAPSNRHDYGDECASAAEVEDQLRTHMLNGTEPPALEKQADDKRAWLSWRDAEVRECWKRAPVDSYVKIPNELDEWKPGKAAPSKAEAS